MDYNFTTYYTNPSLSQSLPPFPVKIPSIFTHYNRRRFTVVAGSSSSGLNAPLEVKSRAGKYLAGVLQNNRNDFHYSVGNQLEQLVDDCDQALARARYTTSHTIHASLYRRIAELKERETQSAIEDVMYILISYKFSEIRVHLIPRLSKCIYKGRLEILPSKDWELESIHSFEVLEMIKDHLGVVVGWKANSNVADNWATTHIERLQLCRIYTASILYGYFLKSASTRYHLELSLANVKYDLGTNTSKRHPLPEFWSHLLKKVVFSQVRSTQSTSAGQVSCSVEKRHVKLSSYVMGFDSEVLQMCAKPKSKEAMNLIEKHSFALFGDEKTNLLESDEMICTSLASLKRFVLEAVAFGTFLWDSEEYVKTVYKLKEN